MNTAIRIAAAAVFALAISAAMLSSTTQAEAGRLKGNLSGTDLGSGR